jgi:RimJ/RimL family protein N-acetyltransferase
MIPVIHTERLTLREWRETDFENYAEMRAHPSSRFIGVMDRNDAWRSMVYFIGHWSVRGYGCWSVEDKASQEAIGYCGPYYPEGWPEPEIAWAIHPRFQRKGLATEAAGAALDFAYRKLKWATAISLVADENEASKALAHKLGAKPEFTTIYRDTPCTVFRHLSPEKFQSYFTGEVTWH